MRAMRVVTLGLIAALAISTSGCAWLQGIFSPRPLSELEMGQNLQEAGKYEEAIQSYKAYINGEGPLSSQAQHFIGECYEGLGQTEKALEAYEEVRDKYGGSPHALWAAAAIERLKKPEGSGTE